MNIELYKEWAAKFYTEDERKKMKQAMTTLKEKLVEKLGLFYDETEMTQKERVAYAEHEVFLLLIEILVAKMHKEGVAEAEILETQRNLWNPYELIESLWSSQKI